MCQSKAHEQKGKTLNLWGLLALLLCVLLGSTARDVSTGILDLTADRAVEGTHAYLEGRRTEAVGFRCARNP